MDNNASFISYDDFRTRLNASLKTIFDEGLICLLIKIGILNPFDGGDGFLIYKDEADICERLMRLNCSLTSMDYEFAGFNGELFNRLIKLSEGTYIRLNQTMEGIRCASIVKNIILYYSNVYVKGKEEEYEIYGINIITNNKHISMYLKGAWQRISDIQSIQKDDFANTSTYMGIKKDIAGFLLETIWPYLDETSVFFDVMCGSGSMSRAAAQYCKVYASDAQDFCCLLAKVQGAGYSPEAAQRVLEDIREPYLRNMEELNSIWGTQADEEDRIFHMDFADIHSVLTKYQEFIDGFELFSSTDSNSDIVSDLIVQRQGNKSRIPFCLFTLYFSNIYFGLEQCMQIDSIRYAIETLQDKKDRDWLLGTLIITASVTASNYGGHFAQPRKIDSNSIKRTIEERERSVWLEFSKRLVAVSTASSHCKNEIMTIKGPMEAALHKIQNFSDAKIVAYLDAPYKREEYSRYYHLLETLAKYDYPSSEKKGRMRSIAKGERFHSEFASRNVIAVETHLTEAIVALVSITGVCCWSYSDNGIANITHIISRVEEETKCHIYIYRIPHKHNFQGKVRKKAKSQNKVIEYSIVFKKSNNV